MTTTAAVIRAVSPVPRLWDGGTVACLATGPSLTHEDVDFVRGKVDGVIAVNDAHKLAPWADVLYSSDRRWWPHYKGVPSFDGMKYGIGSGIGKHNPFSGLPDVCVLKNAGHTGLAMEPDSLMNGRNSGYAALNLAVHLGAKRILLLGYNMGAQRGAMHFFGDHPPTLNQNAALFPIFRRAFKSLVKPLAQLGVEVINCTPNTSLEWFPVRPLREVLR